MQRLRVRFSKRGRLRFTSHRDFSRAFERAVVRAALPMAYSSGFHPHPRISYAGAAPTGAASEAEYLEIGLAQPCDPGEVLTALDAALPDGLDVLEVVESSGGALADRLQASRWLMELSASYPAAVAAVEAFLGSPEVVVERMTKKGLRSFDARAAVLRLSVTEVGTRCDVRLVVRHAEPAVRPDDVLEGLRRVAGLEVTGPPLLTRLAQGVWDDASDTLLDPLSPA